MLCQCRFIRCKKCPISVKDVDNEGGCACVEIGDVDNGGGCACVAAGICGKSLYFSLSFAVNLKLLWKNKSYKKG